MSASGSATNPIRPSFASRAAKWADEHSPIVIFFLSAWYVGLVGRYSLRPLWYDELSTYYIARQPTVARMLEAIRSIDLNPPLDYFLTRWSIQAFGAHPWAARLPGLVAYLAGSLAIFALLRRRANALIAISGVLLFWSNPYFPYAAEARPYGLLLGLTAVLLTTWDAAAGEHRRVALSLVFLSAVLLLLSHLFGVLSLGALWVAEAVRSVRNRRIDLAMVVVLVVPIVATVTYAPMFHVVEHVEYPRESQASLAKLYFTYFAIFRWMWRPLAAVAIVALWLRAKQRVVQERETPAIKVALTLLFLIPLGVVILFMRSHGAYFDRYAMAGVLPIVMVAPMLLWRWTNGGAKASFVAAVSVAVFLLLSTTLRPLLVDAAAAALPPRAATKVVGIVATSEHGPFRPWWKKVPTPQYLVEEEQRAPVLPSLSNFQPELPILPGNELTFVEMDNREPDAVVQRLFYVYDRQSEIEIANRSASITILAVRRFFPLRGTILPYNGFLQEHHKFLVVGTWEHSGDWLLRKLVADGARLEIVGRIQGYADTSVYLVSMPAEQHAIEKARP